jgi:hypothetical protein
MMSQLLKVEREMVIGYVRQTKSINFNLLSMKARLSGIERLMVSLKISPRSRLMPKLI